MKISLTLNLKFDKAKIEPSSVVAVRKNGSVKFAAAGTGLNRAQLKNLDDNEQLDLKIACSNGPSITQRLRVTKKGQRVLAYPVDVWSRYLAPAPTISASAAQVTLNLAPVAAMETRNILLAQGIQFTNGDYGPWPYLRVPEALTAPTAARTGWPNNLARMKSRAPLPITQQGQRFELVSTAQNVKFNLRVVTAKDQYIDGLKTPNLHVVYMGHARYGRGPCFAPRDTPGDNWENGTDAVAGSPQGAPGVTTGVFRMGFPFMASPVIMDVLTHGFTVNLASVSDVLTPSQCEPQLRSHVWSNSVSTWTVADVDKWLQSPAGQKILGERKLPLTSRFSDHVPGKDLKRKLKYFMASDDGVQPHVVIRAGWNDRATDPSNIGITNLVCRVFCHFGCDSRKHNADILRDSSFKAWPKPGAPPGSGDKGFAYFTSAISDAISPVLWLYHLFTYPSVNNFADWKPSLDYALQKSNEDIASFIRAAKKNEPLHDVNYRLVET